MLDAAGKDSKVVRIVTPVNLNPPVSKKAHGIGRGVAGQPRAAETCEIIPLPPVPNTPVPLLMSGCGAHGASLALQTSKPLRPLHVISFQANIVCSAKWTLFAIILLEALYDPWLGCLCAHVKVHAVLIVVI